MPRLGQMGPVSFPCEAELLSLHQRRRCTKQDISRGPWNCSADILHGRPRVSKKRPANQRLGGCSGTLEEETPRSVDLSDSVRWNSHPIGYTVGTSLKNNRTHG